MLPDTFGRPLLPSIVRYHAGGKVEVRIDSETGPLLARKGLEEQAAKLQEQIGQLEGQAKDLAAQRAKLIADAEARAAAAASPTGNAHVPPADG